MRGDWELVRAFYWVRLAIKVTEGNRMTPFFNPPHLLGPMATFTFVNMHRREYVEVMVWNVEYIDEFAHWFNSLTDEQNDDVDAMVTLLEQRGPQLPFPFSSGVNGSRHSHMRELRVQSGGDPIRIFYAFNPLRTAILLIGGDKTGDDRFYETMIPVADKLYDEHLEELKDEGYLNV